MRGAGIEEHASRARRRTTPHRARRGVRGRAFVGVLRARRREGVRTRVRGDHELGHRRREFTPRRRRGARVVRAAAAPHRRSTAGTPRHGRQPNHRPDQNFRRVCEVRGGSPAPGRRRARARVRHRRRRRVAPPPRRPTGTGTRQLSIPRSTRPGRGEVGPRAGSARARGVGARRRAARLRRERRTRRREVRRRRGWRVRRRRRTARGRRRLRRTRRAGSIREARDSRRRGRG